MRAKDSALVVAGMTAIVLSGCGSSLADGSGPTVSTTPRATQEALLDVEGLTIDTTSDRGSMAAMVRGVTSIDARGCWILTTPGDGPKPIVWPLGTRWTDAQRTSVVVRSGVVVHRGESITAGGGYIDKAPRSQVSIAADVNCLMGSTLLYAVVGPDVRTTP